MMATEKTHFGYETVTTKEKTQRVGEVFHSVAQRYDVMNDIMSFGLHRLWKRLGILRLSVKPGHTVLDIAAGTGDLTAAIKKKLGKTGTVVATDINAPKQSDPRVHKTSFSRYNWYV